VAAESQPGGSADARSVKASIELVPAMHEAEYDSSDNDMGPSTLVSRCVYLVLYLWRGETNTNLAIAFSTIRKEMEANDYHSQEDPANTASMQTVCGNVEQQ
jgi:hypothetical protein